MLTKSVSILLGIIILLNGATRLSANLLEGVVVLLIGLVFILGVMYKNTESVFEEE